MRGRMKMEDEYISTGEAAKMLRIGRATVMRYFDQGILTGEKHPITKLRSVDKASVLALMKKYGMKWEEQIEFQGKSDSLERTDAATQKAENDAKKLSPHCG